MRRKALVGILLVCLVLGTIPITTSAQPSPPTEFEGKIDDASIKIYKIDSKIEGGYEIGIENNLWYSKLDVFFDDVYQGTIDEDEWRYFFTPYQVTYIAVAAAEGSFDKDRAWYRILQEEDYTAAEEGNYIRLNIEDIEDNNPDKPGIQVQGVVKIPFEYNIMSTSRLDNHLYQIVVDGEIILNTLAPGSCRNAKSKVPYGEGTLLGGCSAKQLIGRGNDFIELATHLFEKGVHDVELRYSPDILTGSRPPRRFHSNKISLDFQNDYSVNPNWESRFTEHRRLNEIFKADLTISDFNTEFNDGTNVKRLTNDVTKALNENKYFDSAYIPKEEAAELEFVGKNEIKRVKQINDIWKIFGWASDVKTGVEILIKGTDFVTDFNPTKFLVKQLAEKGIGLVISTATQTWKDNLAGDDEDILDIYDSAPPGDLEGNIYGVFTKVHAEQSKYEEYLFSTKVEDDLNKEIIPDDLRDKFKTEGFLLSPSAKVTKAKEDEWVITDERYAKFIIRKEENETLPLLNLNIYNGELKGIINAKKIIWEFTQPFFLNETGKWEFVVTGTSGGGIIDADYIRGGANCVEWLHKPRVISPKKKNTVTFDFEIKPGVFPDYKTVSDMFFVIELPPAYEIMLENKGTGFSLSKFGETDQYSFKRNDEVISEEDIFQILVDESDDSWNICNHGNSTFYYNPMGYTDYAPRIFAVNFNKSLGKPKELQFNLIVDKDLKIDNYGDYKIKYGVFPGNVYKTDTSPGISNTANYNDMLTYNINNANDLGLTDSFSLKITDEVSVGGQVIDKESGEPISNAIVGVPHGVGPVDPFIETDSEGKFNLIYTGEDPFTLVAKKEGYLHNMKKNINYGDYAVFELKKATGIKIIRFEPPKGEYKRGEETATTVAIKNIDSKEQTLWVGLTLFDEMENEYDIPPKSTALKLGEGDEITFTWKVPSEAIAGRYNAATAIWECYDPEKDIMTGALYDEEWEYDIFEVVGDHEMPWTDFDAIFALISDFFKAIIDALNEIVTSLNEKTISVPPEQKAKQNVEEYLDTLSSMADAYSEFIKLIYETSEVEPPEGSEVKFNYHVLSSKFCKNVDEARTYMSSEGIMSTDIRDALELVTELEFEKNGFCIVIVDYSFTSFGEGESGRHPIICNEKGDPSWESWQFYENIKKEIEESYEEYK